MKVTCCSAVCWLLIPCLVLAYESGEERSPFTEVVLQGERAVVTYQGDRYELQSIDGLPVAHIVEYCKLTFRGRWQERFGEDLVRVLTGMEKPPGATVSLVLKDLQNGKLRTVPKAAMTEENRRRVREAFNAREERRRERLLPDELQADLDEFQSILRERWSYYRAGAADFDSAIDKLREQCDQPMPRRDFALALQQIIALGVDGHAAVSHVELPAGNLPFLVEPCQGRFVAFHPDRSALLDDRHPFVDQLDGLPLRDWLAAASEFVPQGSPQYVRRHSLRYLRHVTFLRQRLSSDNFQITEDEPVTVRLVSAHGRSRRDLRLPVADKRPLYGRWPREASKTLDGNIGYLRLTGMSDRADKEIRHWMDKFRDTRGLIVDVRDNSGGTRRPLRTLYSYLAKPNDVPRVVNTARYRLHSERDADHLRPRFLFPADSSHWSEAERKAITVFNDSFRPKWLPPEKEFSPPHYMVLNRLDQPEIYHYDRPIVVMMNEKCFSATDIFLAGIQGLPNVTLIGTPSSGGSARSERHKLPNSDIDITVGSMVSWQPDGKLFDGHGVQPDVPLDPEAEYFVSGADNMLRHAVEIVTRCD